MVKVFQQSLKAYTNLRRFSFIDHGSLKHAVNKPAFWLSVEQILKFVYLALLGQKTIMWQSLFLVMVDLV